MDGIQLVPRDTAAPVKVARPEEAYALIAVLRAGKCPAVLDVREFCDRCPRPRVREHLLFLLRNQGRQHTDGGGPARWRAQRVALCLASRSRWTRTDAGSTSPFRS